MSLREILMLLLVGIFIAGYVLFLLTLNKVLNRCSPESRTISPKSVWLLLIPIFNLFYEFEVVLKISSSLKNEFKRRNIAGGPNPGRNYGLAWCILRLCSIIPILGILAAIAALICWIIYWVEIENYAEKIENPFPSQHT